MEHFLVQQTSNLIAADLIILEQNLKGIKMEHTH